LVNSEAVQEAAELLSKILAQDITGPGEGEPGEGEPGEGEPGEGEPGGGESGGDRSEEGSGDEDFSETASSETASSETASSETAFSETASSETASSETASSETASSETASSETASSETASSETAFSNSPSNDSDGGADAEEGPRIRKGVATDRVISTVDPEMRHGRKSSSTHFDGYKVHITEAVDSEFITGVTVTPGNQHDGAVAEELARQVRERFGRAPSVLIGDSHYGSPDLRAALKETLKEQFEGSCEEKVEVEEEVEVVAKLPTSAGGNGEQFDKTDFEVDVEEGKVTCPAGQTTERSHRARDHKDRPVQRFQFDGDVCAECPLRSECTSAKNGRTITLHYREEKLQEIRAYNETEEFDQRYRQRPKIERKLSELLRLCGLRVGRYLGQKKTELQALLAATVANLKRAGTRLIERLRPATASTGQMAPATG
jgi:hypothetical protein